MKFNGIKYIFYFVVLIIFNYKNTAQNLPIYPASVYIFNDNNNYLQFNSKGFGTNYSTILFDNIPINNCFDNTFNLHQVLSRDNITFENNFTSDNNIKSTNHIGNSLIIKSKTIIADSTILSINGGNINGNIMIFKSYNYDYYYINGLFNFETVNGILVSDSKKIPYNIGNSILANSSRENISFLIKTGLKDKDSELSLSNYFNSNYTEYPLSIYNPSHSIKTDNKWNINISNINYSTDIYNNHLTGNIYYKYSNKNTIFNNFTKNSSFSKKIEDGSFGINNIYSINTNNTYLIDFILNYARNSVSISETKNFSLFKINSEIAKLIISQTYNIDSTFMLGINTGYFINSFNSTIKNKYNIDYNDFNYNIFAKYILSKNNFLKLDFAYNSQSPTMMNIYSDILENYKLLGLNNIISANNMNLEFNYEVSRFFNFNFNLFYSTASNLPEIRNEYLSHTSEKEIIGFQFDILLNLNITNCKVSFSQISSSLNGNYHKYSNNLIIPSNRVIIDFYNKFDFGLAYHIKADYISERYDYNFEYGITKILKEFYAIGFYLSQDFRNKSNIFISLDNILNSYYETYYGYPQNGFNFKAGINLFY